MIQARAYASALYALSQEGKESPKKLGDAFVDLLTRKGHLALLPAIAREYERLLSKYSNRAGKLIVAAAGDAKTYASEVKEALSKLGVSEAPEIVEDPKLIGGFRLEANNQLVDASARKSLIELYRRLTQI